MIESGRISIPGETPWLTEFHREVTVFPHAKHDDQVDSLSQFLIWLDRSKHVPGWVRFPF
jgi:predicted phage terminase large subunit-like protein